jgi:hypothetical protein
MSDVIGQDRLCSQFATVRGLTPQASRVNGIVSEVMISWRFTYLCWNIPNLLPPIHSSFASVRSFKIESQGTGRETPEITPLSPLATRLFHLSGLSQTLRTRLFTAHRRLTSALPAGLQTPGAQANSARSPLSKDRR